MSKLRASSQASVYNYPEHLNPFYEDENHKRIRFWKIKTSSSSSKGGGKDSSEKNKNNNEGGLRRGSFNLGSLRDLLPLRSFRMKKRSSALGINMTSESPPPLRRDIISYNKEDENRYASYDPHFRNTVDNNTFQRNAGYRSSLQNMSSGTNNNFLTFNRNNRYRNTMQNGSSTSSSVKNGRYVYSGSMTPTPKSRYLSDITPRMTPGSSLTSISTNPFDDDEDDEVMEEEYVSKSNNLEVASAVKIGRRKKKRQAPPPPTQQQMLGANLDEKENVELRLNEQRDGLEELSRMTREFENFVRHTHDHEPQILLLNGEVIKKEASIERNVATKPHVVINQNEKVSIEIAIQAENVDSSGKEHIILSSKAVEEKEEEEENERTKALQTIENSNEKLMKTEKIEIPKPIPLEIKTTQIKTSEVKIVELKAPETSEINIIKPPTPPVDDASPRQIEINEKLNPQIIVNEVLKIEEDKDEPPQSIDVITLEVEQLLTEIRSFPEIQRLTPTPTPSREETPDFIPMTVREKFHVKLRIDEDEMNNNIQHSEAIIETKEKQQPFEVKIRDVEFPSATTVPEKDATAIVVRDRTPIPLARTEIEDKLSTQGFRKVTKSEFLKLDELENVEIRRKDSDELIIREGDEPPRPPERRRSVKEIIESINQQQKKLKINQPPSTPQFERKFYYGDSQKFSYHEKPAVPSKENVLLKLKRQEEHERRINEILDDLQGFENSHENYVATHKTQKFPLLLVDSNNNNNSSNNSFPNRKSDSNINPIPKPRRV